MKNTLPIAFSIGEKPSRRKEDKIGSEQITQIHTNNEEAIDLVNYTNKIEKDLSYTSVSGAKINVPMPEPQIASPARLS